MEKRLYDRKERLRQDAGDREQTRLFAACLFVLYQPDLAAQCKHYKDGFCLNQKYCSQKRFWKP